MFIIPAIDIMRGKCVRLFQGDRNKVTIYSHDPLTVAKEWESQGASFLHIVDLDGAFAGSPKSQEMILHIARNLSIPIEVGGGIRSLHTIKEYLSQGVEMVILGTAACRDRDLLSEAVREFPNRIGVAIDSKDGLVAISGWGEVTSLKATDLARDLGALGVSCFVFTDISKDGTLEGPNIESIKEFVREVNIPVIISGGIGTLQDIKNIIALRQERIKGIILGKALYSGDVSLRDAIVLGSKDEGKESKWAG